MCSCDPGWGGEACAEPLCPNGCSGNGNCTAVGKCECASGFGGVDCSQRACGAAGCLHGKCIAAAAGVSITDEAGSAGSVCECFAGWSGRHCDAPVCPQSCSERGECVAPGKCKCLDGWGGASCEACLSDALICGAAQPWRALSPSSNLNVSAMVVDANRGLAYVATWTSPATISAVRLSDGSVASSTTLHHGEAHVRVLLHDASRNRLHAATYTSPARLITLAIDAPAALLDGTGGGLRRMNAVELKEDVSIVSGMLDEGASFAYLASYTTPGAIVAVDLYPKQGPPRVKGRLGLKKGEDHPYVALRDGEHGYFGTHTKHNGTTLVRIHLPTLTRVGSLHLPAVSLLSAGAIEEASERFHHF